MPQRRRHAPPLWMRGGSAAPRRRTRQTHRPGLAATAFRTPHYLQDGGSWREEARTRSREAGRTTLRRMDELRSHPMRGPLLGLAVAGLATPLAVERTAAGADRTDPSHERTVSFAPPISASDEAVADQWRARVRDQSIERALERFSAYPINRELAEAIYDAAVEQEIDPEIAFGLVRAESGFRNHATSVVGAIGITQLMPRTARWMQPGVSNQALRDPRTNAEIGFRYLRYLMDKYDQDENLALLAYNRGPGTVDRLLRRGGNPDNGYAAFVRGEEDHGHTLFSR
jgi:soluble lytic murein transglycosylase-like protein